MNHEVAVCFQHLVCFELFSKARTFPFPHLGSFKVQFIVVFLWSHWNKDRQIWNGRKAVDSRYL